MIRLRWANESPRFAASAEEFRAQARALNRPSQPALPTSPGPARKRALVNARDGTRDLRQARQPRPHAPGAAFAEFEPANVLGMEPATIKISARSFTAALIQLPIPVAANLTVVQSCGTKQAVKVLQTPHPIAKTLLQRA